MRKLIALVAFASLMLAGGAAQPAGKGPITADISFASEPGVSPASFNVHRSEADGTVYWVYNYCWDANDTLLSTEAYPVLWPSWDSLDGGTFPYVFQVSGTHCEALVTIQSWTAHPTKGNSVLDYEVAGA